MGQDLNQMVVICFQISIFEPLKTAGTGEQTISLAL